MGAQPADTVATDWRLFTDWCAAAEVDPTTAGPDDVREFLSLVCASDATSARRVRNIRAYRRDHGMSDPMPPPTPDRGALVAAAGDVLANLVVDGWPDGLRGRRDAVIVVLRGVLGLTRGQVRQLHPRDISVQLGRVTVGGFSVRPAKAPGPCPACGITRWVRVLSESRRHGWGLVRNRMAVHGADHADEQTEHDCVRPILSGWQIAPSLLPPIDHRGLVDDGQELSIRSISAVSLQPSDEPEPTFAAQPEIRVRTEPWDRAQQIAEMASLDPVFDRLEHEIDEAAGRLQRLLDEQGGR